MQCRIISQNKAFHTLINVSPIIFLFSSGHTTVLSLSVLRLRGVESPVFTDMDVDPL